MKTSPVKNNSKFSTTDKKQLGDRGENIAADYLKSIGYEILERNYRASYAEVDIIAKDQSSIVFVEVKTRTYDYYGSPEEFVTRQKQKNMTFAAAIFCEDIDHEGEIRFDIMAIILQGNTRNVKHIKDAFFPGL